MMKQEKDITYDTLMQTIEQARRFEQIPGIEVSEKALEQLGISLNQRKIIHVAGTNGKGSVSTMLAYILREAGYQVGKFTSPHLIDFTERIEVNGKRIPKDTALELGKKLVLEDFGLTLTFFDYSFLMAILYFEQEDCDYIILETGLGGRLDSTNVTKQPLCSIITRIGLDHTGILGDTIEEIASEKAGILKANRPLICASQRKEAREVLVKKATELSCRLYEPDRSKLKVSGINEEGRQEFSYQNQSYELSLLGNYQIENALTVLETICCLRNLGVNIPQECVKVGLKEAVWPGRMQMLSKHPFLLLDGAHNIDGILAMKDTLASWMQGEKFVFCMGVMEDKDYISMVEALLPLAKSFVCVTLQSSRGKSAKALAREIQKRKGKAIDCESIKEALALQNKDEKWIVIGSLYFAGEVLAYWEEKGE